MMKNYFALALVLVAASCTLPVSLSRPEAKGTGVTVTITAGETSQRTVVPDLSVAVAEYKVTLSSQSGLAAQTVSVTSKETAAQFNSVEPGTWDISVAAVAANGTVIGSGLLKGQTVEPGKAVKATVQIGPPTGTTAGAVSFTAKIPVASGVDAVIFGLGKLGEDNALDQQMLPVVNGSVTYTKADVPAGMYGLSIILFSTAKLNPVAGAFLETVRVWPGLTSDRWINPDGTLGLYREFLIEDLFDTNAALAQVDLFSETGDLMSTATDSQAFGLVTTGSRVRFKATSSMSGQRLSYRWNGGPSRPLESGVVSSLLDFRRGTNRLTIDVVAPDMETTRTYRFSCLWEPTYQGLEGVEMVRVPAGDGVFANAPEATRTAYTSSFLMAKCEITEQQWYSVMGTLPPTAGNEDLPRTNITWYDALEYCNKLSEREGVDKVYTIAFPVIVGDHITEASVNIDWTKNGYRLPTDYEWWWAAIGATRSQGFPRATGYGWKEFAGDSDSATGDVAEASQYAWFAGSALGLEAVGQLKPNELGLYDMSGNAAEMCWDRYQDDTSYPLGNLVNFSSRVGNFYSLRGGSYFTSLATMGLASLRAQGDFGAAHPRNGFRVVRGARTFLDFEGMSLASIQGQQGWTSVAGYPFLVASGATAPNYTTYAKRGAISSGTATAHVPWNFAALKVGDPDRTYRFVADVNAFTNVAKVAIACDINRDATITGFDSQELALSVFVDPSLNELGVNLPSGQTRTVSFDSLGFGPWVRFELQLRGDLVTVRVKSPGTFAWTTVWSNLTLGLNSTALDKRNPRLWDRIALVNGAGGGEVDNIGFEEVFEQGETTVQVVPDLSLSGPSVLKVADAAVFRATPGLSMYEWFVNGSPQSGVTEEAFVLKGTNPALWVGANRVLVVGWSTSGHFSAESTVTLVGGAP